MQRFQKSEKHEKDSKDLSGQNLNENGNLKGKQNIDVSLASEDICQLRKPGFYFLCPLTAHKFRN